MASETETDSQIRMLLDNFTGEETLKHLFWELLSYDRVREQLPLSLLPPSAVECTTSLEVFAATEAFTIVLVTVKFVPLDGRLEQMAWAVKRHIPNCVVLLHDSSSWLVIFPDEKLKPRVRMVPLPGPEARRTEIAQALAALNAADETSGQELSALELAQCLDEAFPGATPNIADLLTEFERIAQHPDPEMRDMWPLIKAAGQYPLLTPAQERGDDLSGEEMVPDGTHLPYQQWRLVVHNLRLVVWLARKWRGRGLEIADLVQEGIFGLMTAADRYDPSRGNRFTTFAYWWILQGVTRALFNGCNLIRWPVYKAPELMKAFREGRREGLDAGEQPPIRVPIPLYLPHNDEGDPFDILLAMETVAGVREVLSDLKPQQLEVVNRRFGIDSGEEETLEQIGQDFGVSRERIRQIEAKSLKRLRGHYMADRLKTHCESVQWRVNHSPESLKPYDADHLFGISAAGTIVPIVNR